MALEEEFDIEISEEAAPTIQTVGAAIDYVIRHTESIASVSPQTQS